jgi:hypothetical protein
LKKKSDKTYDTSYAALPAALITFTFMIFLNLRPSFLHKHPKSMQAGQDASFRGRRCFSKADWDQCSERAKSRTLENTNNDEHSNVHAPCSQSTSNDTCMRCDKQGLFPAYLVGRKSTSKRSDTGSEEEESINGAENMVCVCRSWTN